MRIRHGLEDEHLSCCADDLPDFLTGWTERIASDAADDLPQDPERRRTILRLRREIESGEYERSGRLELAIDRLIACHFPSTLAPAPAAVSAP